MKNRILLFFVVSAALLSLCGCGRDWSTVSQVRKIESKYNGIKVSDSIAVSVSSGADRITVVCDRKLQRYVIVNVAHNVLNIEYDRRGGDDFNVQVTVPFSPELNYLNASSGAAISVDATLTAPEISFRASSDATIDAEVNTRSCRVDINGGASVEVRGTARKCHVQATGGARFTATDLEVEDFSSRTDGRAFIYR